MKLNATHSQFIDTNAFALVFIVVPVVLQHAIGAMSKFKHPVCVALVWRARRNRGRWLG